MSLPDADALVEQDPNQFQWWALELVGARPVEQKKGADRGIDGRIYFHDEADDRAGTKQIVLSVKAGKIGPDQMRDLRGVVDREGAAIGALISMHEATHPMRSEAASAGFFESAALAGRRYPRLQLLTVPELLDGKGIDMPAIWHEMTFKKAPKAKRKGQKHRALPFSETE